MAGPEELQQFLADPEKYVPPLAPRELPAPELLPKRHSPKQVKASQSIELKGYCPVTFLDGQCRYELYTFDIIFLAFINKLFLLIIKTKTWLYPDLFSIMAISLMSEVMLQL